MSVEFRWLENHGEQETQVGVVVVGPTTRTALFVALLAELPATYGTFVFKSVDSCRLVEGTLDVWDCQISYGAFRDKRELQAGESEFRFGSSRRNVVRTVSIASRVYMLAKNSISQTTAADNLVDNPPPPDARIVKYTGKSSGGPGDAAEGAEVTEYLNQFSWRVAVPFSTATESWRRDVGNLRGHVNSGSFFGYSAGEVLFEDITGGVKGDGIYMFELAFAQTPNVTDLNVGGILVDKKGWEYVDASKMDFQSFGPLPHQDGWIPRQLLPVVDAVKVHQMYPESSFAPMATLLGLGGGG